MSIVALAVGPGSGWFPLPDFLEVLFFPVSVLADRLRSEILLGCAVALDSLAWAAAMYVTLSLVTWPRRGSG